MVEEIRKLLLYLRKTSGKYEFTETEILNTLSIRTRYLTPDQVREFLRIAVEKRCLKQTDDSYSITCSINGIELSLDYRPNFDAIMNEQEGEDDAESIITYVMDKTGMNKREIVSEINKIREKNPFLSNKVAALMVARLNGLEVDNFLITS